ncbi:MAG: peroxiredoxin [Victivallales bacterium]|nr:peroxiredoxin [Victivallales bacterium]
MCTLVTKEAPDFTAQALMADNTIKEDFSLSSLRGKHVVLFFYPLDFTFVCPTEIIAFNRKLDEFKKRGVEVVGISVDSQFSHFAWKNTKPENGGIGDIQFPLVADLSKNISRDYGVLFGEEVALRGLFLIDKEGIVRHCVINDLPLGRSVDEALRMVDALQFFEENGEVCPANWHKGEDGMNPSADGVADYLAKH